MHKILDAYKTFEVRQAQLFAQMQSGKSGIFLGLAVRMLHESLVDRVYIICGSNEVELYDQMKDNWRDIKHLFATGPHANLATYHKMNTAVHIYKSSDLKRIPRDVSRSLIIWDESHFAQDVKNKPAEFLREAGFLVTGTEKSHETWVSKDSYFLSVSATPFAELAAAKGKTTQATHKATIVHKPADCYIGVTQLKAQLRKSFLIKSNVEGFKALLGTVAPKKYVLVRSRNIEVVQACCRELGIRCLEYTQGTKSNLAGGMNALKQEPAVTTVVCLKGMCKMGKVVPKRYIGMTFEETQTSNTDTVLQSFVGRMCGHNSPTDPYPDTLPLIYVPEKLMKGQANYTEIDRYIRMGDLEDILPVRAAHVAAPPKTQAMRTGLFSTVPIVVPLVDEDPEEYGAASALSDRFGALGNDQAWMVRNNADKEDILAAIRSHLTAHPLSDKRQQDDMLAKLTVGSLSCHNMHCYDYAEDLATGLEACAAANKRFDDKWTSADNFIKVYRKPGAHLDALYIAARTELAEYETVLEQKNALPTAEESSVFTQDELELVPTTALAPAPISHDVVLINSMLELQAFTNSLMTRAGIHTAYLHKSLKGNELVKTMLKRVKTEGAIRKGSKMFPRKANRDEYMVERITIEVKITVEITVRVSR